MCRRVILPVLNIFERRNIFHVLYPRGEALKRVTCDALYPTYPSSHILKWVGVGHPALSLLQPPMHLCTCVFISSYLRVFLCFSYAGVYQCIRLCFVDNSWQEVVHVQMSRYIARDVHLHLQGKRCLITEKRHQSHLLYPGSAFSLCILSHYQTLIGGQC